MAPEMKYALTLDRGGAKVAVGDTSKADTSGAMLLSETEGNRRLHGAARLLADRSRNARRSDQALIDFVGRPCGAASCHTFLVASRSADDAASLRAAAGDAEAALVQLKACNPTILGVLSTDVLRCDCATSILRNSLTSALAIRRSTQSAHAESSRTMQRSRPTAVSEDTTTARAALVGC